MCLLPNLTSLIVKNATLADADALLSFAAFRTKGQGEMKAFPRGLRNVLLVGKNNIGAWYESQIVDKLEGVTVFAKARGECFNFLSRTCPYAVYEPAFR